MFDAQLRPLIDPPLNAAGQWLARSGCSANAVTLTGFALGLCAVPALLIGAHWLAFAFIVLNRLADGLDGAVARVTGPSDRGGYLDIVCDFIVYSAVPFALAAADPERNALPAAFVLFAFMGTGSSFLAFAILAAKRGLTSDRRGKKTIFYLGGLAEGAETIAFLLLVTAVPDLFPAAAWIYGAMCWITTGTRMHEAWVAFGGAVGGDVKTGDGTKVGD